MLLPQFPECTESIAADVQIVRARSLRLLLERMKDVERIRSRCHVEHAVCTAPLLDAPTLEAGQAPCDSRKRPKVTPRGRTPAASTMQRQVATETPASCTICQLTILSAVAGR